MITALRWGSHATPRFNAVKKAACERWVDPVYYLAGLDWPAADHLASAQSHADAVKL